uniref:Uncharacterized protein n=1 Tax=Populus trichocarpa TaxID=3694 RepID=A0A3N7G6L2_POPTR
MFQREQHLLLKDHTPWKNISIYYCVVLSKFAIT